MALEWQRGWVDMDTIFMPLLDEGTKVWRPVQAKHISADMFQILDAVQPPDERWAFPPGSIVRCSERDSVDGPFWVAESLA